jgi:hypothetical protein
MVRAGKLRVWKQRTIVLQGLRTNLVKLPENKRIKDGCIPWLYLLISGVISLIVKPVRWDSYFAQGDSGMPEWSTILTSDG